MPSRASLSTFSIQLGVFSFFLVIIEFEFFTFRPTTYACIYLDWRGFRVTTLSLVDIQQIVESSLILVKTSLIPVARIPQGSYINRTNAVRTAVQLVALVSVDAVYLCLCFADFVL